MQEPAHHHPHGPLRRKDREITDRTEIDAIIRSEKLMHIALVDGELPFLVPVFYAFDGTALYFHSAQAGRKIEIIMRNNNVCFEISVDHGFIESDEACDFEARHRTVIGMGKAVFVEDAAEKIKALDLIVAHFSEQKFEYPQTNLDRTAVIRIDIVSLQGKKHGV
ncbi:pyridoxamine 5'-phosphate oxidase family protein [Geobacter sp. SVR]|uniref:pyridoxamine 5'-phosphate oxidase family protein n=1 Tax=Geobacter sp. SVR TaxID=2495594 RepID=UPI00143F03A1|nr:pyridoxamine 5'-phosphate oxidase family protein [Geobacter sp. SVR]BCS55070.1 antibiotic transporter [Geobacter sp. SVR]GCF85252.1 antibiotic transporter [Geobacter sp. SVR]